MEDLFLFLYPYAYSHVYCRCILSNPILSYQIISDHFAKQYTIQKILIQPTIYIHLQPDAVRQVAAIVLRKRIGGHWTKFDSQTKSGWIYIYIYCWLCEYCVLFCKMVGYNLIHLRREDRIGENTKAVYVRMYMNTERTLPQSILNREKTFACSSEDNNRNRTRCRNALELHQFKLYHSAPESVQFCSSGKIPTGSLPFRLRTPIFQLHVHELFWPSKIIIPIVSSPCVHVPAKSPPPQTTRFFPMSSHQNLSISLSSPPSLTNLYHRFCTDRRINGLNVCIYVSPAPPYS